MRRAARLFHSGFSEDGNTVNKVHCGFEHYIFMEITAEGKQTYCDHMKVLKD